MLYDLFICHATEDKTFVRSLAAVLRKEHVEVWFDELNIVVGDSLRESIDRGLAQSRFAAVVLSNSFFAKRWTARELNGLVAREMAGEDKVILPIWHGVEHKDVVRYSAPLADVRAIDSRKGVRHVARELLRRVRPQQSPFVVARDELIAFGMTPPVVTDEWWLKVVVDSSRLDGWGMSIPDEQVWGRWSFPLPDGSASPEAMGLRLAWAALQRNWVQAADDQKVTQITQPEKVLAFISRQPALTEVCHEFPAWLATYAPQLTIRTFGGSFEGEFDRLLKMDPSAEELMLRREARRRPSAARVACQFVQGDIGGPHPRYYSHFDYLIWLLSQDSQWLPTDIRELLRKGMREWNVWWRSDHLLHNSDRPFVKWLWDVQDQARGYKLPVAARADLLDLIDMSLTTLGLRDDPAEILHQFLAYKYTAYSISQARKKHR